MDATNRMLLDYLQRSFPLVSEPYRHLAEVLNLQEPDVIGRIRDLKEARLIRQISAIFNTGALGYRSSLVAMAVPENHLVGAAQIVNAYPGVSHNYLRPGKYNMWYTIAVPPGQSVRAVVQQLSSLAGDWPTLILPALRKYKLAVVLDVLDEAETECAPEEQEIPSTEASMTFLPSAENIRIVRCVQEDLPLVSTPFETWAQELEMPANDLLGCLQDWIGRGLIRRFAAVLNHRQVGFNANGMVVWNCPEELIDHYGSILAGFAEVSHCYHRPAHREWPYNLYAMVHGRSVEDCEKIARRLAEAIDIKDYRIMFSTREFKKIRLKLFWDEPALPVA